MSGVDLRFASLAARRTAAALALPALLTSGAAILLSASTEASSTLWLFSGLPLATWAAARTARAWRTHELDWIGSRPVSPARLVASWWLGAWAAGGALTLLALLPAFASSPPDWVQRARPEHPGGLLVGTDALSFTLEVPASDAPRRVGVRARTAVVPALPGGATGPVASLRLRLRSSDGAAVADAEAADAWVADTSIGLSGRGWVELDLPRVAGPHVLELTRVGEGPAVVVGPDALRLLERDDRRLAGACRTSLRLAMLLGALQAVALCLGVWLSPTTAAVGTWTLWLPVWSGGSRELPGAEVWEMLTNLGRGIAPTAPSPVQAAVWMGLLGAAWALARAGLTPWKRGVG